ncbi:MAG: PhzF family phenazine biosynthesis protein [Vallitaleaceae bacterium]|nr:PhzF family phenazine biosynthesis protein [Vallitaleaceae bacterium]
MKNLEFKKIDAFTKGLSSGNPAGYVLLETADQLTEDEMQKMASELKGYVNEVGFVFRQGKTFELKFYSSECEVAFCGHATIAIMYDVISTDPELMHEKELKIKVKSGILSVFNHIEEEDAVYIMAPEPQFLEREVNWFEIAEALDTDMSSFDKDKLFQVVDGGLRTLLVPMISLEACLKINPYQEILKQFCLKKDIDIVLVFTQEVHTKKASYRTRVFAPKFGYLEDPATGSGNSAFGYYLVHNKLWQEDFSIEQSATLNNPNSVKIKRYQKEQMDRILFGGSGTTRIAGRYYLQEASDPLLL